MIAFAREAAAIADYETPPMSLTFVDLGFEFSLSDHRGRPHVYVGPHPHVSLSDRYWSHLIDERSRHEAGPVKATMGRLELLQIEFVGVPELGMRTLPVFMGWCYHCRRLHGRTWGTGTTSDNVVITPFCDVQFDRDNLKAMLSLWPMDSPQGRGTVDPRLIRMKRFVR